jgi:hypothetical protein
MRLLWPCLALALVLTAGALPAIAVAHSGGLDRCGGHHDRKRGGYHVHNRVKYCACSPAADGCQRTKPPESEAQAGDPAPRVEPPGRPAPPPAAVR